MVRLVRLLDYLIPLGIYVFILYAGIIVAIAHVGIGWLYLHEKRIYAAGENDEVKGDVSWLNILFLAKAIYVSTALILCGFSLTFYTKLVFHKPPTPPLELPEALRNKTVVFECVDEHGSLAKCTKGNCNGRLKPPRTHHCSVCGDCRLGFDHHCHWVGNCITLETRKQFLAFLGLTTITVITLATPIREIAWKHILEALRYSRQHPTARKYWWDMWYSWILVGGPFGRLPMGVAFGFHLLAAQGRKGSIWELGTIITQPSMGLFISLLLALGFALFTFFMAIFGIRDVLKGSTTFDKMISKPRGTLYWIPAGADGQSAGMVVPCQPETNPYGFGYWHNWEDLMERPFYGDVSDKRDLIPNINEKLLTKPGASSVLS